MAISFKGILNGFLNIFRSAAEKAWNNLDKDLQGHALTATALAQAIKTSIGVGYVDFIAKASTLTGLSTSQLENIITNIAKDFGITVQSADQAYKSIQEKAQSIQSDNGWNAIWQDVMKFGATYISSGRLDWVSLSFGIAEVAYQKLFKK